MWSDFSVMYYGCSAVKCYVQWSAVMYGMVTMQWSAVLCGVVAL